MIKGIYFTKRVEKWQEGDGTLHILIYLSPIEAKA